jgi:hypothetical protein
MMAISCAIARAKLARKVAELRKAGALEKTTTAIKAGFVGSIVTPMRALAGNASWGGLRHLALQPAEAAVDYMLSVGKSARTKFKVSPHEFREVANALDADGLSAMWGGFKKGGRPVTDAYKAAKGAGGPIPRRIAAFVQELSTRLDADQVAKVVDVERVKYSSPVSQTLVDGAFAVLEAADRPFWKLGFDGSLYMQGKLMAIREGLKGPALRSRAAYYFENPTDEMNLRAADDANYATFKDRNVMSRTATSIKRGLRSAADKSPDPAATGYDRVRQKAKQRGAKIGHYVVETNMPFTGVPSSVATKILQVSPLGFFSPSLFGSQAERARALATAGGGTAIMAAGFLLAKKGLITQAMPRDPKERAQWDEEGRQPWSVKIGKDWVGLQALGPVASPLFMGAKLQDVRRDSPEAGAGEQAARVAAGAGQFFTQQTYLQQLSRLIDAAQDEKKAAALVASQIPLPAAGGQINRLIDGKTRDTKTIKDQIVTKIPGASRLAPEKLTPTGHSIDRSIEERIAAVVSPLPLRRSTETPLTQEMRRSRRHVRDAGEIDHVPRQEDPARTAGVSRDARGGRTARADRAREPDEAAAIRGRERRAEGEGDGARDRADARRRSSAGAIRESLGPGRSSSGRGLGSGRPGDSPARDPGAKGCRRSRGDESGDRFASVPADRRARGASGRERSEVPRQE